MDKMCYNLKNKVFLITGGTRGIGLELARSLLAEDARVVICARKQEGLDAAVAMLGGGDSLLAVQAHVAREEDVKKLFAAVLQKFGRLDVLVNNVGMNLLTQSVSDTEFATWQKIVDSNLNGTFLCASRAARIMKEQKKGKIISISSIAATKASPGMGVYGVAKAGIEMLTKVLAAELASYDIQVNAVAPAMVRTEFSKYFWGNQELYPQIIGAIPAGRIAEPNDVVQTVLFLSSDAAGFISGQTIMVDGGATAI